jgi:hypothetical protein
MPGSPTLWRLSATLLTLGVCLGSAASSAQDKDTVWTKASATGAVISLSWDKQHPWDQVLTARGAELIAKYRVESGREVTESLARTAVRSPGERMLRFTLPAGVNANLRGSICLFIQLADRRILPIRRATKQDNDTAGFRYDAWEEQARRRVDAGAAERRVAEARRALDVSTAELANQQAAISARGLGTNESCDGLVGPAAEIGPTPYDIVPPAQQDDVARRVCVRRVWVGRAIYQNFIEEGTQRLAPMAVSRDLDAAREQLKSPYARVFMIPEVAGPLLAELRDSMGADHPSVRAHEEQAARFLRDWMRYASTVGQYQPQAGSPTDYLRWPSTAAEAAFRLYGADLARLLHAEWAMVNVPAATATEKEGVVGAALSAYDGCVEDAVKQLRTKYDSWRASQASAPQRATAAREFLVRECRQDITRLAKLKAEQAALEDQLAREQQLLRDKTTSTSLPARPQALNGAACRTQ